METKSKVKKLLLCAIALILTCGLSVNINNQMFAANSTACNIAVKDYSESMTALVQKDLKQAVFANDSLVKKAKRDSLKTHMIIEVDKYIRKQAPNAHSNLAMLLVEAGLESNINIAFMMAQTQFETNFGTAGAGRPTSRHSLFGVLGKYANYDAAINGYTSLLKRSYLTKGRTEMDLMKKFTTTRGGRYCPSSDYESRLRKHYSQVNYRCDVERLQKEYRNLEKS